MARKARGFWLEQRGGIWRACWTERGPDGRSRKLTRSCSTRDEGEAQQWLERFRDALERPEQPPEPTVASILDGYLHDRKGRVVDFERIELCAKHLKQHVGWLTIQDLRPRHSTIYTAQRRGSVPTLSDGTIGRELRTLRAALHWAYGERLVGQIPKVLIPPGPNPRDRWLTREEAERLIAAAVTPHVRLFIRLALSTAARSGAILELRWIDVDLEQARIDFGQGHGHKRRAVVPIAARLGEALADARLAAQTPWVIEHGGAGVASIKKGFRRSVERAGIAHCTPHDMRRTAGSWMLQAGIPIEVVSRMLGHTNTDITAKVYAWHDVEFLRRAAKALEG